MSVVILSIQNNIPELFINPSGLENTRQKHDKGIFRDQSKSHVLGLISENMSELFFETEIYSEYNDFSNKTRTVSGHDGRYSF